MVALTNLQKCTGSWCSFWSIGGCITYLTAWEKQRQVLLGEHYISAARSWYYDFILAPEIISWPCHDPVPDL